MYSRNSLGERRLAPAWYKFFLTLHVIVSVGWLGTAFAKVVLGLVGVSSSSGETTRNLLMAMEVLNVAFPPLAVSTIVTGVLLSLGTRWGLLQHYWVVTKLVLTVGVIATSVSLGGHWAQNAIAAASGVAVPESSIFGIVVEPATLALSLTITHILMLALATVVSTYKPWGKTWFGRRGKPASRRMDYTMPGARSQSAGSE